MNEDEALAITIGCILLFCGCIMMRLAWKHNEDDLIPSRNIKLLDTV
jgi:hypothetical protein